MKTSYQEIEKRLGKQDLKVFAYPYGAYTKESVFVLKMSGIDMQVYDIGVNNFKDFNKHYIKRINIPCEMTGLEIIEEINASTNQYVFKERFSKRSFGFQADYVRERHKKRR